MLPQLLFVVDVELIALGNALATTLRHTQSRLLTKLLLDPLNPLSVVLVQIVEADLFDAEHD